MHLKSLEIHGFKSFPEKTILSFNDDITAIVGPNGSGKSNISDALRWVMGEQSNKALRGSKMEDVIFSGSSGRSPSGFAQVTLLLENGDGDLPMDSPEVAITRRIYRSGESEYYINRRSVRLKDINELFMDTGLGRDGYSVIGQGRIDEILSAKSTERREVFEEAAGISRFRSRKEDAEKKLEGAAANLLRINDKIAELELQLSPLREQAEVAKRFLTLRDELKGLESALWLEELKRVAAVAQKHRENSRVALEQSEGAKKAQQELYARTEELEGNSRELESLAEELRTEISHFELMIVSLENEAETAAASIRVNEENLARIREEMLQREEHGRTLQEQLLSKKLRISQIDKELESLNDRTVQFRRQAQENTDLAEGAAGLLAQRLEHRLELRNEQAALNAQIDAIHEQDKLSSSRSALLENELISAQAKCEAADKEEAATRSELDKARVNATYRGNIVQGCAKKFESRTGEQMQAAKLASQEKDALTAMNSRWNILSDMEKEYEGYSRAVKKIMQEKDRGSLRNIHGPVSHLMHIEDPYVTAIETALAGSLQNIVVSREEDAKAAIAMLQRTDSGRATFLPLSSIRSSLLNEPNILKENGFVGLASGLISFDSAYEGIFGSLLGRTVVTEDLDAAIAIGRKYGHRFKIVTLDGQLISAGGAMTGGSLARSAGILSRSAELARLTLERQESVNKLEKLEQKAREAETAAAAAKIEFESALKLQRVEEDKVLTLTGQLGQKTAEKNALVEARARLRRDIESESGARIQREAAIQTLAAKLQAASGEILKLEALLAETEEGTQQLKTVAQELRKELEAIDSSTAALTAQKSAELTLVAEYSLMAGEIGTFRSERLSAMGQFESDSQKLLLIADSKRAQAQAASSQLEQKRLELDELAVQRSAADEERQELKKGIQDKNAEIVTLEREVARLENRCAESDLEEKQLIDKLWDAYGLTRETAAQAAAPIASAGKARQRVSELRKEITSLGTPNLGAVEEYERVSGRWEYLSGQRDDAQSAKRELENIIRSLTGEMRVLFIERFAQINDKFQETFAEIFEGGTAGVYLEDTDSVLDCGIEIRIQPPGKKVRSISLLSGGEKAFAAIALYFAIIKIRPTPFCVLDEIETALDEVNAARFATYLKRISQKTQIVVVTHRRPTMELAGILYGVTMHAKGISKVLTLALDEAEEELFA